MNCGEWQELIELSVEGALDPAQARVLEAHISACAACREFAAGLAETQIALADLRHVSPGPEEYEQLRRGVMDRIAARRRRAVWVPYAVAAGLLLALFAGYRPDHGPDHRPDHRPERAPEGRPDTPASGVHTPGYTPFHETQPFQAAGSPRATFRVKRTPRHAVTRQKTEPLVIKMATADPDVLIIWFVDKKGD